MSEELGVGASLGRKEDHRHLHGRGQFVADIRMARMQDVAFVRSPVAHGRLRAIDVPDAVAGSVFTARDMEGVRGIYAPSGLPGFKTSEQPALVSERIRYVGELIAACVAPTRAIAEDIAEEVALDIDPLGAVSDMTRARDDDAPLLHGTWGDNVFLESFVDNGIEEHIRGAAVKVSRTFRTSRQCMSPIEGRGVLAYWNDRLDQLVVYTACQMPHVVRQGLAECLNLPVAQVRLIPPDVGGGFGYKGILTPEEVCVSWLAMTLRRPVRWIEDRREQLTANANCREHYYEITGYANREGDLLGIDCEAIVDAGAYSAYPFSACLEAAQVPSILPGPYDFPGYRCRTWCVATNKPAILPYRGVARTGVCFALEVLLDAMAREVGLDAVKFRERNLVQADQMPFDNVTNKHFDSGDYPECLRRAAAAIEANRGELEPRAENERVGVGYAVFCEQAAHGTSVYAAWGVPMIPGHEQATARLTADGGLELRVGIQSHGQGLETTLAQVAHQVLGVHPDRVMVVHGDTAHTPYSTGTWGSRCMVMAGGAVAAACEELAVRVVRLGAHLLQVDPSACEIHDGKVIGPSGDVSLADVGALWYRHPEDLPNEVDPHGLEVTQGYKAERDSGTFSYACHACVVKVDVDIGSVRILDYVVVEDGGVLVNPMIVDGQVYGGTAQGIGTALYEAMPFDAMGQPLASTLADYHLPGASEVPTIRIEHMETPSPYTRFGQKGIGEGGAIGPPAAIANAINDALAPLGVEVERLPITRDHLLSKLLGSLATPEKQG
ncbi:MAG: xanthine dehydrogenase family protein molybdopterin-binding subunit [Pseudomonadota bacterium]